MKDCIGVPVDSQVLEEIPPQILRNFNHPSCCRAYDIDWNGRHVRDITCSPSSNLQKCQVNIKIFRATIYRYCFEQGWKEVSEQLGQKKNFTLNGM